MRRALKSGPGDSCGCAASAKALAVALVVSAAYYGWRCWRGELSSGRMLARVLIVTFVAATLGKVFGIVRYRWRGRAAFRMAR